MAKQPKRRAMFPEEREAFLAKVREGYAPRAVRDVMKISGSMYKRTCEECPEFKQAVADASDVPLSKLVALLMEKALAGDGDAQRFLINHFARMKLAGQRLDIQRREFRLKEAIAKGELKGGGIDLLKLLCDNAA